LESQIDHTISLTDNLKKQKDKLEQELHIAEKDVDRNRKLNEAGTIPDSDLEKIETQFLQHQRQLDVMESQIVRNDINIEQLTTQIPDSMVTTYGKSIPFRQEMQGTANIITEDRRILERVFDRVYNLVKN